MKNINALEWESCGLDNETISTILIDPRNDDIVYVGSRSNFSDGIYGKIFKSTDSGATWDTLLYGIDPWDMAIYPDSSHILFVALGIANFTIPGIIKTTDSGIHWVKADSGIKVDWETGVECIAIDPVHPDTLFAGTGGFMGGNLYYSYNAGESWTNIVPYEIDCVAEGWPDICRLRNSIVTIIINPINSNILYIGNDRSGDVLKSTDGGQTWALTGLSDQGIIGDLLMDRQDTETLFASSSKGFYKTTNGGLDWYDLNTGREKPFAVTRMIQNPKRMEEIVIASWQYDVSIGGIFRTIDGGLHWQQIDTSFSNKKIWSMAFTQDGRTLFIGGGFTGLYKTTLETSVGNMHTEDKSSFRLLQNYPNPFNMNTNIHYRLLYPCQVSLKIFNTKGREIRTLIDANQDKGMHIIQWDGKNNAGYYTASGIYILRFVIDSYVDYRKLVYAK